MGYSPEVKAKAINKIKERKLEAERLAAQRREKIFSEIPQASEYEHKIASCAIKAGRAVIKGGDTKTELEALKNESLKLQQEYSELLKSNGYSVSDTEPDYFCKKCNDTGYYDTDNRTVMCSCLKKAMVEEACAELNRNSPLKLSTFEDFDLNLYSKDKEDDLPRSPYEQMSKILDYCKNYAKNFTKNSESIFMKGMTGLGKTHLSLAIANEVIKKGYGVIYASAPILVSKLEKEQFRRDIDAFGTEDALIRCDLLIVDDLGTEFSNKFSAGAIYNLFNSRLLLGKPVIINTNLDLDELEDIYTQRFVSRIIGETRKLDFFGKDIRIIKRNK